MTKRNFKVFSQEEKDFIFENNYMKTAKEVAELFNKHFKEKITGSQVKNFRSRYKIKSGLTGRFEKGQEPFNKGKKWDEFMSKEGQKNSLKTTFKKGQVPQNQRQVGSERVNVYGYVEIKTQDGKGRNNWELKHRVIWENANGPIPKDHLVMFADGDKNNLSIDNLILISKKENAVLNKRGLRYDNKETTKLGITLANLILKTSEIKRGD